MLLSEQPAILINLSLPMVLTGTRQAEPVIAVEPPDIGSDGRVIPVVTRGFSKMQALLKQRELQ